MNSPGARSSPKFKNLKKDQRSSPIEIKEKMRKSYKAKIQNCRDMLLNRFRGTGEENDLRNTFAEIFNFTDTHLLEDEVMLEEIKNELIQEEFEWWLEEYDKSQFDVDLSALEQESNVICPICQKNNLCLVNNVLLCSICRYTIKTQLSLPDVKKSILYSLEKHSSVCKSEFQFALLSELNESHICLMCDSCLEMQMVV